jgi:hypothetical protein
VLPTKKDALLLILVAVSYLLFMAVSPMLI